MKLLVMSDLHFEFLGDHGESFLAREWPEHDVCVIAGDLCSAKHLPLAVQRCADTFREIVYVPGNHEYYGSSIDSVKGILTKAAAWNKNFHYLDNDSCIVDGQRFLGGTMWFPKEFDTSRRRGMNDFQMIKDWQSIYGENASFMSRVMPQVETGDVVVTHHLPSYRSVAPQFAGNWLNCYFVNDVSAEIADAGPKMWIHGHTHTTFDYLIGQTRIVCNPQGYPGENSGFVRGMVVEV